MTARRLLVLLWVVLAVAIWNGVFDLLVTRGVKEYLYRSAEHARGRGPEVTMDVIMAQTIRDGVVTASAWALLIGTAGLYSTLSRSR
jgi:hypothetical protein